MAVAAAVAVAGSAPGGSCTLSVLDLPEPILDSIFQLLGLTDLAAVSCASQELCHLAIRALGQKEGLSAADLPSLASAHNLLLLYSAPPPPDRRRHSILSYLPQALHHASRYCQALQRLHLELPPPQVPLAAAAEAVARAAAGEPWGGPAPAEGLHNCPPVDGFLLKLLAQARQSRRAAASQANLPCAFHAGISVPPPLPAPPPAPCSAAPTCARCGSSM